MGKSRLWFFREGEQKRGHTNFGGTEKGYNIFLRDTERGYTDFISREKF